MKWTLVRLTLNIFQQFDLIVIISDDDTIFTSFSTNDYWPDSTLVNDYDDMDISEDFTVPFDDFEPPDFSRIAGGSWASARARRTR